MAFNRPRGRQKNVTGKGSSIKRRGSGLGTGPVGGAGRGSGIGGSFPGSRPESNGSAPVGGSNRNVTRSGNSGMIKLIVLVLVLLLGGGGGLTGLLSNSGSPDNSYTPNNSNQSYAD